MSKNENLEYFVEKKSKKSEKMSCEHNGHNCIFHFSLCDHKNFQKNCKKEGEKVGFFLVKKCQKIFDTKKGQKCCD